MVVGCHKRWCGSIKRAITRKNPRIHISDPKILWCLHLYCRMGRNVLYWSDPSKYRLVFFPANPTESHNFSHLLCKLFFMRIFWEKEARSKRKVFCTIWMRQFMLHPSSASCAETWLFFLSMCCRCATIVLSDPCIIPLIQGKNAPLREKTHSAKIYVWLFSSDM